MKLSHVIAVMAMVMGLSACTTTTMTTRTGQLSAPGFEPPAGGYRLIVMQPDISVYVLTAGDTVERREDWSKQARENVLNALREQQAKRGGTMIIAETIEAAGGDPATAADLYHLHAAISQSIREHKFWRAKLPTKKNQFDWTLGSAAVAYGAQTNYDYALFLHAYDSFSSANRIVTRVATTALSCSLGLCLIPGGGMQISFASLVDLKSGQIVWFNNIPQNVGDIRTPEGAEKTVHQLLNKMAAAPADLPPP